MPRYICSSVFKTSVGIGKNVGLYNLEPSYLLGGLFLKQKD